MTEVSIDVNVNGALHKRLVDALNKRFRLSAERMSRLHDRWRKSEEQFIAFLPEREIDAKRRAVREAGKPQYTTIVLPYTYAMLMSAHSYWTTVFLSREPIFQYMGRHGEAEQQIQALEALISYQVSVGRMLVPFYFWLLDTGKYGLGVVADYWEDERYPVSSSIEEDEIDPIMGLPTGKKIKRIETQLVQGYSGSKIINVRPYDYYPDPRVPLWDVERCEFVGYTTDGSLNDLLRGKASGRYVNVDYFRAKQGNYGGYSSANQGSEQIELPLSQSYTYTASELNETGPFGMLTMYVNLVPTEWGLGKGEYPEKWVFTAGVTRGSVRGERSSITTIFEARPHGAIHNKFPISIMEMEPEAYAFAARGMPEVMKPLQDSMDWLLNSHMYNVRKVLNDQFIIDPSRIVMKDYLEGGPGQGIRLKPAAYGTDVRTALSQLQVQDVTRAHIADINFLHEFSQRAVGVNDQIMGLLNAGGRKTAQEVRSSSTFGVNRQKTIAELCSAMGFAPLGERLVQNSQQYYEGQMKLRIVGDLIQDAGPRFLMVDPQSIAGVYDFVPVDGTMPIDRYQQANLWKEILVGIRQMPEIAAQYDIGKIFAFVARLAGLKNIGQFRVQVVPDGMAQGLAQRGNVVPIQPPPGPPVGLPQPRRGVTDLGRTLEPAQVPNMGTSG